MSREKMLSKESVKILHRLYIDYVFDLQKQYTIRMLMGKLYSLAVGIKDKGIT